MRDTVNMTQLGIRCVGLVHNRFEKLAKLQCVQLGEPDLPIIYYEQDLPAVEPPEKVSAKAKMVADLCHTHIAQV